MAEPRRGFFGNILKTSKILCKVKPVHSTQVQKIIGKANSTPEDLSLTLSAGNLMFPLEGCILMFLLGGKGGLL